MATEKNRPAAPLAGDKKPFRQSEEAPREPSGVNPRDAGAIEYESWRGNRPGGGKYG
jgi:hypothetical protein